jgi:hypothetical protein
MKALNLVIIFAVISLIFGSFFALAAELDLKITAKLNGFDTDFYAETDSDANVSFDSYDFEQRSFPSGNWSFLLSNIGTKNLTIDSWPKADRIINLTYRISPISTGTLNLTWDSGEFGAGNDSFNAILTDYGTDSTYSNIVSTVDMEQNSSYEANVNGSAYRYLTMNIDYYTTPPTTPPGPGPECTDQCTPGSKETQCASGNTVQERTCGNTDDDSCTEWEDWTDKTACSGTQVCYNNDCCSPYCVSGSCGDDGCGGNCTCAPGFECKNRECVEKKCTFDFQCNDNNPCTDDRCLNSQCDFNTFNFGSCDDNNGCTTGDECRGGSCQAGARKECPLGETCNPDTGNCEEGEPINNSELPEEIQDTLCSGSQIFCGDYSECTGQYDANMLINGAGVTGVRTRTCIDKTRCASSFIQTEPCSLKQEVTVDKKIWCEEEYTEVRDANTGAVLSRIKTSNTGKTVNIDINAAGEGYCYYCYDGIKNHDEEGIDCGGSCTSCEIKTVEYPVQVYNIAKLLLWLILFLFFLVCLILIGTDLALFLRDIFMLRKLGGKYEYWGKKGYDVEVLDKNLHKMEKAYEDKLKHHHHYKK